MRRLGLIGGMSWESSIEYERLINQTVRRHRGGMASADLLIRSFDFSVVENLQSSGEWEKAGRLLAEAGKQLESVGAQALVLCTNTMHQVADVVTEATDIPLLHIVQATGERVLETPCRKPLLLGTAYTMEKPFYRDALRNDFHLDVVTPLEHERTVVHRIIYEELVRGVVADSSREDMLHLIDRAIKEDQVDGVIAACTEIELLVAQEHLSVPYFPTTAIHAEYAATWSLGV